MNIHLQKDLQELKRYLLEMCRLVSESVRTAVKAFEERDPELAKRVIKQDHKIDAIENEILVFCMKILALHHPLARDLRFITSAMSMIRDLERLGDQAVNIAERVEDIVKRGVFTCPVDLSDMAKEALGMLDGALEAFVTQDPEKACAVCLRDGKVDDFQNVLIGQVIECMKSNPQIIDMGVDYIIAIQNLERVADLATNISEEVVFLVEGRIIRHTEICESYISEIKEEKFEISKRKEVIEKKDLFDLLEEHARLVIRCVNMLPKALEVFFQKNLEACHKIYTDLVQIEREADSLKKNIRGHLPHGIILPVDKFELFMYLKEQDAIADAAEEILKWLTFKEYEVSEDISFQLVLLTKHNIETTELLIPLLEYAKAYLSLEDTIAREKAKEVIRNIRSREHESDEIATTLKREIFNIEQDAVSILHLLRVTELICQLSGRAENAGDLMRAMLAKV
ncbi:phosphate uptake regulator, PhoU [Thermodesulfatator indicus DSM 15286]|uniref:Phosphate-specific transport system accessory protein PhoU homolog n=1 Tax=Thermodesulfatator indicus (strain DSM 15286 / JCM 11887 / CIR29812) TaxID=667014 RepID=F8A929_THEID|nr:phosphate signaling complex protein PhoU [Thermodesulfatator indicus]AEH45157.1 phosphate uptake regulator, PhoU [Thermodesulfatator indicus DSM 15286]